jgi:hypothetical protein
MQLDLTDEEAAALINLLTGIIEADQYPIFRSLKHCNARGAGRDLGRNTTGIAPAPAVRRSRIAPLAAPDLDRRALSETAKDRVGDPVRLQARSRFRPTHPAATMSSGAPVHEVGLSLWGCQSFLSTWL